MSADPRAIEVVRSRGETALAANAAVPVSALPNPSAKPFVFGSGSEVDWNNATACLTSAIYFESAIEPEDGQRAVAQVVLNRVRHPAWPNSVCGVVFQGVERVTGCQFTFTCDGALRREPHPALWKKAQVIAKEALAGKVFTPVGLSTHYHTDWIVPYWADSLVKAQVVGTHIFYRWMGGWGRPAAFRSRYSGSEPILKVMTWLSGRVGPLGRPTLIGAAFAAAAPETAEVQDQPLDTLTAEVEIPPLVGAPPSIAQAKPAADVPMADPPKVMLDRIQQYCRSKKRCFKKQKLHLQQVFAALAAAPGDPTWRLCTTAASQGVLTDWVKAKQCLADAGGKSFVVSVRDASVPNLTQDRVRTRP